MIKAVVFDCFGVLAYDGWLAYKERFFDEKPDLLEQAIESNRKSDAGLITYDDFLDDISRLAGISKDETRKIVEHNPPNEALFAYIRDTLKPQYEIGLLSNASDNWLDDLFQPWQVALFDETVLSYQVGAIKPDPIMYATIAAKLGVHPEECVFVDDQPWFVEGGTRAGMQAFLFEDTKTTIAKIEELIRA